MERNRITDIKGIFTAFGRTVDLAEAIEQPLWRVEKWRQRGRIPAEYWSGICEAAAENGQAGISVELLMKLHATPISERSRRASAG